MWRGRLHTSMAATRKPCVSNTWMLLSFSLETYTRWGVGAGSCACAVDRQALAMMPAPSASAERRKRTR